MNTRRLPRLIPGLILIMLALSLAGCASYHQPRYGDDGVYYDRPQVQYRAVHADPLLYPYWSLDYFYFSRYYHPYSVLVNSFDPWYYPYPGWYYGYGSVPRTRVSISYGHQWYPWFGFGHHYHYYQPWGFRYVHYPRYRHEGWTQQPRVRQVDERLRDLERRQRGQAAAHRQPRGPAIHADGISTRRAAAGSQPTDQQVRQASAVRRSIQQREQAPAAGVPRARQPAPRVPLSSHPGETTSERAGSHERRTIRPGTPGQTQQPAARQSEGIPTRSIPRQAPAQPHAPSQRPSSRQQSPATRQPTSPPPSQPTTRPQSQSPPPRQRSAPVRQRDSGRSSRRERR